MGCNMDSEFKQFTKTMYKTHPKDKVDEVVKQINEIKDKKGNELNTQQKCNLLYIAMKGVKK